MLFRRATLPLIVLLNSKLVIGEAGSTKVPYTSFSPGKVWLDTDGNRIKAHSAGLLQHNDTFFWYGADNYTNQDGSN